MTLRAFAIRGACALLFGCAPCAAVAAPPPATVPLPVGAPGAGFALERAAYEHARGDARAVVTLLEPLDWHTPAFPGAGRAALLLADAYRTNGDAARLTALAAAVAAWPARDGFAALVSDLAAAGVSATDAGAEALARAAAQLASGDTEAADRTLQAVADDPRWGARARHVRALVALERGDVARAAESLEPLAADTLYSGRREARLALAGLALEQRDWARAAAHAGAADSDWQRQRAALAGASAAALWRAWEAAPDTSCVRPFDGRARGAEAARVAAAAARLWTAEAPEWRESAAPEPQGALAPAESPTASEWRAVIEADLAALAAREAAQRALVTARAESASLADLRRYLRGGRAQVGALDARLAPVAGRLDSLRTAIAALEAHLRTVRALAQARVAARVRALATLADAVALRAAALDRLHVAGPDSAHWLHAPAGHASAARALREERTLTTRVAELNLSIGQRTPGWLARSLDEAWRPALVERIARQSRDAARERAWAAALGRSLDSSYAAAAGSAAERQARLAALAAGRAADAATQRATALRARVAADAIARTERALEREREGLDHLRASAAYALAVRLDVRDTLVQAARVAAPAGSGDDDSGDPIARAEARALLRAFLERHPNSAARAEARFRLADLELLEARRAFRERMAAFLRAQEAGAQPSAVPVLEPAAALALYRRMLAEDAAFPHLDAVRFNTAMILAESGSDEAAMHFRAVLERWPDSPWAQESALRLGDLAFNDKRWREAAPYYTRAAAGGDPTLAAIARYKGGWTAYNEDRHEAAAREFGAVLDLYEARRDDVHVDVEQEAATYFVLSLAAAGGAAAHERHFHAVGPRGYAHRTLLELGQQLRRNGELAAAAAADSLLLARAPLHADALLAAERQVATLQRAGDLEALERAQERLAPLFAPRSPWASRQPDSLRVAGERFAVRTSAARAAEAHERARRTGRTDDWRRAIAADEGALVHATAAPERASLRLDMARAHAATGAHAAALAACDEAVNGAPDSLAAAALAFAVVTSDAWYERERAGAARGPETSAARVRAAGDALLARFPGHALGADVRWRQAQLALAHGDDAGACGALGDLLARERSGERAPRAAWQLAEATRRLGRHADADGAYAEAARLARSAGQLDLALRADAARQDCAYAAAAAEVARDTSAYERHARAYEGAASRWPAHADADAARYRAALAWERAARPADAARVLAALTADRPRSALARDAWVLLGRQHELLGDSLAAGDAFLASAALEREAGAAAAARLRAADDYAAAGRLARADSLRLDHVRRHPGDLDVALAVYERRASRELDEVAAGRPLAGLLPAAAPRGRATTPRSATAEYLRLAKLRPDLASRPLLARLRYLQAEEARRAAAQVRLELPLARSLGARRTLMDSALVRYRRAADTGAPEWSHAAAWRIGETLREFASALEASPAPAGIEGDDLEEYRAVLAEKARPFATRGLDAWVELARVGGEGDAPDTWVARAREAVALHLAERFRFRPEVTFPAFDAERVSASREGATR